MFGNIPHRHKPKTAYPATYAEQEVYELRVKNMFDLQPSFSDRLKNIWQYNYHYKNNAKGKQAVIYVF